MALDLTTAASIAASYGLSLADAGVLAVIANSAAEAEAVAALFEKEEPEE